jgi:hypothetical protein
MLGELADLAMDIARDLAAKTKAADNLEDAQRCSRAFDRMTRAVRLTVALRHRLHSDADKHWSARRTTAVELRKAQVRASMHAAIRDESGLKSYDVRRVEMERELDDRVAEQALYDAFLDSAAGSGRRPAPPDPRPAPESRRQGEGRPMATPRLQPPPAAARCVPPQGGGS